MCAGSNSRARSAAASNGLRSMWHAMTPQLPDWRSFWDVATPEQGATAMIDLYGPAAAKAVLKCAAAAVSDDRHEDYRFWKAVLTCLQGPEKMSDGIAVRN
jgi:hypothetical protein